MPRRRQHQIKTAIALSLALHLVFWLSLDLVGPLPSWRNDAIEIEVLDPAEQKKLAENQRDQRQVVEQDQKSLNEDIPEDAKYLSRFDQKVAKQTKAAQSGDFSNAAQPGQRTLGQQQKTAKSEPAKKTRNQGDLPSLKDLSPQFSTTPKADSEKPADQQGLASQTNDYLPDVETGLQTILNTREFVYFAYYQRIREKIRSYWEPKIREKVAKVFASGRTIASTSSRITKVIIVLNANGSLVKVQVIGESGITDLDQAAVEAFKAAEPFPNPPDGIVEEDGLIRIRWDFVLEANYQGGPLERDSSRRS